MTTTYIAGNPVRLIVAVTQLQSNGTYAPADVTPLNIYVHSSDGTPQTPPTVVHDGLGAYHADFLIPIAGKRGTWNWISQTTNATPGLNGLGPGSFEVKPPPFTPP